MSGLVELGWNGTFASAFAPLASGGQVPARVAVENRASYELLTETGAARAAVSGRLRHEAAGRGALPAVGDWVVFAPGADGGLGTIEAVLPRSSAFTRKAAGQGKVEQIVAVNVDVVFIVTSLNTELNPRRLERYLTLAWESGASPVVVLSKRDRAEDPTALVQEAEKAAGGVPVLLTSAKSGEGIDALRAMLQPNRTGALLGSSGVGKSTIINALLGFERQSTGKVRENDDKGRHTTTRRELVLLPGGGLLIDTPGMRELQLAEAGHGLLGAFSDIDELAKSCTFGDCTHGPEPGCAVKAAVTAGTLDADRLESYHKLVRELEHRATWEDKRLASEANKKVRMVHKALQKRVREKGGE